MAASTIQYVSKGLDSSQDPYYRRPCQLLDWGSGGSNVGGYQGNYAGTIDSGGFYMDSGMVGSFMLDSFTAIANRQGQIQNVQALRNHIQNGINNAFNNSGSNGGFMPQWNDFNSNIASPLNAVSGIFEQGAKRSGLTTSTINAFNKKALSETLQAAKIAKIAGRVSMLGNASQIGYSACAIYQNPNSAGNWTRLGVQLTILGLETGLNAVVPGLGVAVGLGLNVLEATYGQELYDYMDNEFNKK